MKRIVDMEECSLIDLKLNSSWTFYIHTQSVSTTYGIAYNKIGKFDNVLDFWRYMNNMPDVVHIHSNIVLYKGKRVVAYSLFKDNILPEWEKTNNINGSEWGCRENISKESVSSLWQLLVLACIGEHIPNCVGLRYINKCNKLRTVHKIEIWMNTCQLSKVSQTLKSMREVIETKHNFPKFTLMRHNDKKSQALEYNNNKRRHSA